MRGLISFVVLLSFAVSPETGRAQSPADLEKALLKAKEAEDYAAARKAGEELLASQRKQHGPDHWRAKDAILELAHIDMLARLTPDQRKLLRKAGQQLERGVAQARQGKAREVEGDVRKALEVRRKLLGDKHTDVALALHNLSFVLEQQARYAEAEKLNREALAIHQAALGERHPQTALDLSILAHDLEQQDRVAEALALERTALAIRLETLGENDPQTAWSCESIGHQLTLLSRHGEAETFLRRALAIRKSVLKEHVDTARSYHNLALNLSRLDKHAEAADMYRQALAIRRKLLGEENAATAQSSHNLALELGEMGKHAEAEVINRRTLALRLKIFGKQHLATAWSCHNLAVNLRNLGKDAEAEQLDSRALAIRRQLLGEDHTDTAWSYSNLAIALRNQDKDADAEPMHRRALAIRRKVLGEKHVDTAQSYHNLAIDLRAQGKNVEAEKLSRRALDLRRELLGEKHVDTAHSYNNLGLDLTNLGRPAEAEPLDRRALAIRRELLGDADLDTAWSYHNLGIDLLQLDRQAEAEEMLNKALAIRRKLLGENHALTQATRSLCLLTSGQLADVRLPGLRELSGMPGDRQLDPGLVYELQAGLLVFQGKYAEAELFLRRALQMYRSAVGGNPLKTATTYSLLGLNLRAQGRHAEAEEFLTKALELYRSTRGETDFLTLLAGQQLADYLIGQGQYEQAAAILEKTRSLAEKAGASPITLANILSSMAHNLESQERYREGEKLRREVLAILPPDLQGVDRLQPPLAWFALGNNLLAQEEPARAEPWLRKALVLQKRLIGEYHPLCAWTYQRLASCLTLEGKWLEAETMATAAADIFLKARLYVASSGLERAAFSEENSPLGFAAAIAGINGKADQAWRYLEQDLARGLLDDLSWRQRLAPAELQRFRQLLGRLQDADRQLASLAVVDKTAQKVAAERDRLQRELEDFQAEQEKQHGLAAGQVYDLPHIQKHLPASAALVVWTDVPSWACVVRRHGPPAWIQLTSKLWTREQLALPGRLRAALNKPPDDFSEDFRNLANQLARQLLEPLEAHLKAKDGLPEVTHLVVLPSRALAGIPIEVLTDKYRISYAPSGTMFAWLKEHEAASSSDGSLLALGDPAFRPGTQPESSGSVRGPTFKPLPGTRAEVAAIARLFQSAGHKTELLLGPDASEQRLEQLLKDKQLAGFRFLHLATHGVPDERGGLQSYLALAQDRRTAAAALGASESIHTGRLTAARILATWKLDADLVTLSACQTGLGKHQGGEGYVGFSQALFLAGARSLLLSLWRVDDRATALLMTRFYRNLLGRRPGLERPLPRAAALAEAKHWLRCLTPDDISSQLRRLSDRPGSDLAPLPKQIDSARPFEHPFFWAGFILIGEPGDLTPLPALRPPSDLPMALPALAPPAADSTRWLLTALVLTAALALAVGRAWLLRCPRQSA